MLSSRRILAGVSSDAHHFNLQVSSGKPSFSIARLAMKRLNYALRDVVVVLPCSSNSISSIWQSAALAHRVILSEDNQALEAKNLAAATTVHQVLTGAFRA
jgi:hypothetical protein